MKNSSVLHAAPAAALLTVFAAALAANAQVNVTTYHNDNSRTGQNTQETVLTTANVAYSTFGKLFSVAVDGNVYAQPLVFSNVTIGGGTHNVVYAATENDSVYAIDAQNGTIYWQKSLILNGGSAIPDGILTGNLPDTWNNNIAPHYGITGTPVIDPTTNTIYVVASTDESGVHHRLHALNVASGAEKFGGPVVISGSYGGRYLQLPTTSIVQRFYYRAGMSSLPSVSPATNAPTVGFFPIARAHWRRKRSSTPILEQSAGPCG